MASESEFARASARTLQQAHELWIWPALLHKFGQDGPPPDYRVFQCLVLLPSKDSPVVQINDEVAWIQQVQMTEPCGAGDLLVNHQVRRVTGVRPPSINGKPVPYFYLYRTGGDTFAMVFDFSAREASHDSDKWLHQDAITEHLNEVLIERAIIQAEASTEHLNRVGLWLAPALVPYPLSRIAYIASAGKNESIDDLLCFECGDDWLTRRASLWTQCPEFASRVNITNEALACIRSGFHGAAVHLLVPQVEGVLSDLASRVDGGNASTKAEKRRLRAKEILTQREAAYSFARIAASSLDFIIDGLVFQSFRWGETPTPPKLNRHAITHGATLSGWFSRADAVRAFLMLDTIWWLICRRDVPGFTIAHLGVVKPPDKNAAKSVMGS